ncbi:unnamed protein product [Ilex paraguariensis]|uniref:Uncharacterized protein n=1 Tax=Ilex paraguariensis TaxID=185542 RepID=A0ABC8R3N2_9AQUA
MPKVVQCPSPAMWYSQRVFEMKFLGGGFGITLSGIGLMRLLLPTLGAVVTKGLVMSHTFGVLLSSWRWIELGRLPWLIGLVGELYESVYATFGRESKAPMFASDILVTFLWNLIRD